MSWQVGNYCVETELQAAQATAAANNGVMFSTSAGVVEVMVGNVTETSIQYILRNVSANSQVNRTVIFSAQECQLLTVTDGIQMGWLVGAVWLAAFCLMFLTRALRGDERESSYGNS